MEVWLLLVTVRVFSVRICFWNFLRRAFHTSPHFLEDNSDTALPNGMYASTSLPSFTDNSSIYGWPLYKASFVPSIRTTKLHGYDSPGESLNF